MIFAGYKRFCPTTRFTFFRTTTRHDYTWCEDKCASNGMKVAVPFDEDEYWCLVEKAGGRAIPFWTGIAFSPHGLFARETTFPVEVHGYIRNGQNGTFLHETIARDKQTIGNNRIYLHNGLYVQVRDTYSGDGKTPPLQCACSSGCPLLNKSSLQATFNTTDFTFPNTVRVKCNHGYWLPKNSTMLKCNKVADWSPSPKPCQKIECPTLKNLKHMYSSVPARSGVYNLDENVTYTCHDGYKLVSRESRGKRGVLRTTFKTTCSRPDENVSRPTGVWKPSPNDYLCENTS